MKTMSIEAARSLRAARTLLGLRQIDLAQKAGLSLATVSRLERGLIQPHRATEAALFRVLAGGVTESLARATAELDQVIVRLTALLSPSDKGDVH